LIEGRVEGGEIILDADDEPGGRKSMTDETATMPGGTDIEMMDLPAVQAELAAYMPATSSAVVTLADWLARRRALWRRLDMLVRAGAGEPDAAGLPASPPPPLANDRLIEKWWPIIKEAGIKAE
jgi:hypothetical protein